MKHIQKYQIASKTSLKVYKTNYNIIISYDIMISDYDEIINGEWKKREKIPDTLSEWGTFIELQEKNTTKVIDIYRDSKLKDFFNKLVMIDEIKAMNKLHEIVDIIDRIDSLKTLGRYIGFLAKLSIYPFFYISVKEDQNENTIQKLTISNTNVSLPHFYENCKNNFSYYDSDIIMAKYKNTIMNIFEYYHTSDYNNVKKDQRLGGNFKGIDQIVIDVQTIERAIYKNIKPLEERRKWAKYYNKMTIQKFIESYDDEDYRVMMHNIFLTSGTHIAKSLIIYDLEYFKGIYDIITTYPLSAIKNYIKYNVITSLGHGILENIDKILFPLFGMIIEGTKQLHTRERRIHDIIQHYNIVSETVGKIYIERYFDKKKEDAINNMFSRIKTELKKTFEHSEWMSENTKVQAIKKVNYLVTQIGYPKVWNEYKDFYKIIENENDAFTMYCNMRLYSFWDSVIHKIDKPSEPYKWRMPVYEVNAYYNPTRNEIVIPAGILQQPFFDTQNSISQNYGFIGSIIGHELMHGFDDQGRNYDYQGNINNWWSYEDNEKYKAITIMMIQQYNEYNINGSQVNGSRVIGEAIADLGGVKLSLATLCDILRDVPVDSYKMKLEMSTFFSSYAKIWRKLTREEKQKVRNLNDLHSPEKYRVYVLRNIDEFYEMIGDKIDDANGMYLPKDMRIQLF